jgi:predicted Zn-dependent peptidase
VNGIRCVFVLALGCFGLQGQNLAEFEKKVTGFRLANGLQFVVAERHDAPVVSFHTYVKAGSANDPTGQTGLAHMFEHMAFKGTETVGTTNWPAEERALATVDALARQVEAERNRGRLASAERLGELEAKLNAAIERAQSFVVPNEYTRLIEENGGAGLNAGTSWDSTDYFYSLPSNRLELWFLMESQRFLHPVFREFYKERDVVREEQRERVESSPSGQLGQSFASAAFEASPYRNPAIGWPSDIGRLRRDEAERFFSTYYVPGNVTIAIVGDVNPADARRLAERYFGPWPARPLPPAIHTEEPKQAGPKTVVVESSSQPLLMEGYKRPDEYDPDDAVFDVLSLVLSGGRTGLLYKELVQGKELALQAEAVSAYPGTLQSGLFLFFVVPALGHTVEENRAALDAVLTKLGQEGIDAETLARVKTKARAGVIRRLADNSGLAEMLASAQAEFGSWKKLFTSLDEIDRVTTADVVRVARRYFVPSGRTTGYTVAAPSAAETGPEARP